MGCGSAAQTRFVDMYLNQGNIRVGRSNVHHFGVYAAQNFSCNDLIEECYVLKIDEDRNDLSNYIFRVDKNLFLPLGYGAIYNHATLPNAHIFFDEERSVFRITANQYIGLGEEIFISYGSGWFESRNIKPKNLTYIHFKQKIIFPIFRFLTVFVGLILIILFLSPIHNV